MQVVVADAVDRLIFTKLYHRQDPGIALRSGVELLKA